MDSGISISIRAGLDAATSSVSATGSIQHVITDKEVESFQIKDAALKNAIGKYFGQNPDDTFLHSDTPWGDLYKTYAWPQVQTVLVPQSATITSITSEPVIISTKSFKNTSSKKATFNAGISDQVSNTTEENWSKTDTLSIDQTFKYEVSFLGTGGGGETKLSYSHTWGKGGSESQSVTVGSDAGVTVDLEPGEAVEAQLTASRGVMKIRIVYRAYLIGNTAINYGGTFKGHHFWALDIQGVMAAGGIPSSLEFTQDIEVGYYSSSKVELKDSRGLMRPLLLAKPGPVAQSPQVPAAL